jgi:hypothetical protein
VNSECNSTDITSLSSQGALLAIEPTSLYYFISKDSNHVQGGINKIMFFVEILHISSN